MSEFKRWTDKEIIDLASCIPADIADKVDWLFSHLYECYAELDRLPQAQPTEGEKCQHIAPK